MLIVIDPFLPDNGRTVSVIHNGKLVASGGNARVCKAFGIPHIYEQMDPKTRRISKESFSKGLEVLRQDPLSNVYLEE